MNQWVHEIFPFLFLSRRIHFYNRGSGRGEATWRGGHPPPDSDPFSDVDFGKNPPAWQDKLLPANHASRRERMAGSLAEILWIVQRRSRSRLTELDMSAYSLDF